MSVLLRAGEYLWASAGHHVCDADGFAVKLEEDTEVTFDTQNIEDVALAVIHADREFRELNPDGTPVE